MSHSKMTKRGCSQYIEKWNPSAKKYIHTCVLCGRLGYNPAIEEDGFQNGDPERTAIYAELRKTLEVLELDSLGRCRACAKIMDK